MSVTLWLDGDFNGEKIDGDMGSVLESLNAAAAAGHQYTMLEGPSGGVLVNTHRITKIKENDSAFLGE